MNAYEPRDIIEYREKPVTKWKSRMVSYKLTIALLLVALSTLAYYTVNREFETLESKLIESQSMAYSNDCKPSTPAQSDTLSVESHPLPLPVPKTFEPSQASTGQPVILPDLNQAVKEEFQPLTLPYESLQRKYNSVVAKIKYDRNRIQTLQHAIGMMNSEIAERELDIKVQRDIYDRLKSYKADAGVRQ